MRSLSPPPPLQNVCCHIFICITHFFFYFVRFVLLFSVCVCMCVSVAWPVSESAPEYTCDGSPNLSLSLPIHISHERTSPCKQRIKKATRTERKQYEGVRKWKR